LYTLPPDILPHLQADLFLFPCPDESVSFLGIYLRSPPKSFICPLRNTLYGKKAVWRKSLLRTFFRNLLRIYFVGALSPFFFLTELEGASATAFAFLGIGQQFLLKFHLSPAKFPKKLNDAP